MENEIGDALRKDLGRELFVSWMTELAGVEEKIDHTIAHLKQWMKDEIVDTPMLIAPGTSKCIYEPLGVVLVMGSWNFPLFTTIGPLIYVIAAGNCAVIKPSEFSPSTCKIIRKLIVKYLDMNCYACIEGGVEVAKACTSKKFDSIIFTGSSEKGKLVA
jgi:aldehyde dehydrogenase (NAD+)